MTAKATGEYSIRYQYLGGQLRKLNEAGGGLNLEASKTSKTYRLSAKYSLGYTHSMEAGLPMLSRMEQHDRYTITTDATGITQEWAPLSGRYFMLNFACRLRSMNPPRYFGGLKSGEE